MLGDEQKEKILGFFTLEFFLLFIESLAKAKEEIYV